jgi:hypothetical protein
MPSQTIGFAFLDFFANLIIIDLVILNLDGRKRGSALGGPINRGRPTRLTVRRKRGQKL